MNIKKCSNCGWEFPGTYRYRTCKFCGARFKQGKCRQCGEWTDDLKAGDICAECRKKKLYAWEARRRQRAEDAFVAWKGRIASIPTPYKTLTEAEWLDACNHFGGCAICGERSIDARAMFITFEDGGRYCAWNIIPACERCETIRKGMSNPWLKFDNTIHRRSTHQAKKYGFTMDNLQRIVDYLQPKLEEAANDNR